MTFLLLKISFCLELFHRQLFLRQVKTSGMIAHSTERPTSIRGFVKLLCKIVWLLQALRGEFRIILKVSVFFKVIEPLSIATECFIAVKEFYFSLFKVYNTSLRCSRRVLITPYGSSFYLSLDIGRVFVGFLVILLK